VLWTWPGAEQAAQSSPRSVPSGPPVSLPASAELAPRAEPMLQLAAAAEPTERAPKEARAKAQPARAKQLALKGHRLRKVGRLRAARQAYQAALVAQPGMPPALAGLVELQLAQHDAAQALETVQELLKHRQSPDDLRLLGDVSMLAGRREQALAAYHRAAARGNATARARLKRRAP
jgi:tetratricopeptide (TPR) repeat protein